MDSSGNIKEKKGEKLSTVRSNRINNVWKYSQKPVCKRAAVTFLAKQHRCYNNYNCSYFLIRNKLNPYHEKETSFSKGNLKKNRNNIRNDMYVLIYIFQFLNFTFYWKGIILYIIYAFISKDMQSGNIYKIVHIQNM